MIINYPTGLYAVALESSDNVTYTISNQDPPRTDLLYPKLPIGILLRRRTSSPTSNRGNYGDLIYSSSMASRRSEGNNARVYESGQILEFNDSSDRTIEPMLTPDNTNIRHDLSVNDNDYIGITDDEQSFIDQNTYYVQNLLLDELNTIKQDRYDAEQNVSTQQKLINQINKNISALKVVNDVSNDPDISAIIAKLEGNLQQAISSRDESVTIANQAATRSSEITDRLNSLSRIVK